MSGREILLCPLGMVATGGIAWALTGLPGKRVERVARIARRSTCVPPSAKQPPKAKPSTQETSAENEVAERV
jgi:hypothetical protein